MIVPNYKSGRGPTPGWGFDFGPNRQKQKNVSCLSGSDWLKWLSEILDFPQRSSLLI